MKTAQIIGDCRDRDAAGEYRAAVATYTEGLEAVSTGLCPGCETCREEYAPGMTLEQFGDAWSNGEVFAEPSFSWSGCDLCGSTLGGDFEPWHAIDENGEIVHGDRACIDCICYLANGDLPERWQR